MIIERKKSQAIERVTGKKNSLMPSPKHFLKQLEIITGDLIKMGICSHSNFPKISTKQPEIEDQPSKI